MSKIINLMLMIIGIVLLIYGIVLSFSINSISKIIIIIGIFSIITSILKFLLKKYEVIQCFNSVDNIINVVVILVLTSVIIVEVAIVKEGSVKNKESTDYILVLGAGLWGDVPSDTLIRRLDGAIELSKVNDNSLIVVSGGQGFGETVTEAEAMERYLVSKGLDKNRIVKEEKATNTSENIIFSKEIIDSIWTSKEKYKVTIITNNFHCFRSKFLSKRAGVNSVTYSVDVQKAIKPAYFIREYFGVIKSYFVDR